MALPCFGIKKCQCKRNCESWFVGDPGLTEGCKDRCRATGGDQPTSKESYLMEFGIGGPDSGKKFEWPGWATALIAAIVIIILVIVFVRIYRKIKTK